MFALLICGCQLCQKREKKKKKESKKGTHHINTFEANFLKLSLQTFLLLLSALVLKVCCSAVSTEVLLDMKATGGELGWLTWPLDQGERPGVSPPPSLLLPLPPSTLLQLPRSHLEFAFRIKYCREQILQDGSRGRLTLVWFCLRVRLAVRAHVVSP